MTDIELVRRCLAGSNDAWHKIVKRYERRVFCIAYQFVGRYEEAEDLTQELFLKIFSSLDRFKEDGNFPRWLMKIARNLCIDHYRRRKKEMELVVANGEEALLPADAKADPYGRARRKEKREILREALNQLPPDLKTAVVMRDIQGYSYKEIAAGLKVPEGTVKSRINRGRTELARLLIKSKDDLSQEHSAPHETRRKVSPYKPH
ncbi:RNA polymerase sigma factor [Acidobacteriota bacterium]